MATKNFLDSAGVSELLAKINTWGHNQFVEDADLSKLIKSITYTQASRQLTITFYDGTTSTITLPAGSTAVAGLTKLYTVTGSNSDGAYTQAALSKSTSGDSGSNLIGVEAITSGSVSLTAGTLKAVLTSLAGLVNTNKTDIATNKTSIATNASDIASLKDTVDTLSGGGGTLADYVKKADLASTTSGSDGASMVGVAEITSGNITLDGESLDGVLQTIADSLNQADESISTNATNIAKKVDKTTTVNGHALSANVTVAPADLAYSNSLVSNTTGSTALSTTVANVKAALDAIISQVNTNTAAAEAGLQCTVVTSLPTASESTAGRLYLVASANGNKDAYDEYVTVSTAKSDGTASYDYSWEKLGSTGDLRLSDYWAQADLVALTTTEVDGLCNTCLK